MPYIILATYFKLPVVEANHTAVALISVWINFLGKRWGRIVFLSLMTQAKVIVAVVAGLF